MTYRLLLTWWALKQRCGNDQNWWFGRWTPLVHWWVTAKCIASIWIGIERDGTNGIDGIVVAYIDWGRTFDGETAGAAGEVLYAPRYGFGYAVEWDGWP